jgi:hypothetical protein
VDRRGAVPLRPGRPGQRLPPHPVRQPADRARAGPPAVLRRVPRQPADERDRPELRRRLAAHQRPGHVRVPPDRVHQPGSRRHPLVLLHRHRPGHRRTQRRQRAGRRAGGR